MEICQYVYKNFFQLFFHDGLQASHILSRAQYLHITESGFYFMEISHEMKNTGLFCPMFSKRECIFTAYSPYRGKSANWFVYQ